MTTTNVKIQIPLSLDSNEGTVAEIQERAGEYSVNPEVWIQQGQEIPSEVDTDLPEDLCQNLGEQRPILWVKNPDTLVTLPFWPTEAAASRISSLSSGSLPVGDLRDGEIQTLLNASVVLNGNSEPHTPSLADSSVSDDGYLILRDLLKQPFLDGLRDYVKRLEEAGALTLDDPQVPLRAVLHNERFAQFIHRQLTPYVCQLTGASVKPSYAYLSAYKGGAILHRHIDRIQCVWNVSLVLDMEPCVPVEQAWPLYLEAAGKVHEIRLGLGDGVLYRGNHLPHWREELPENEQFTACLFHFVPSSFEGCLD